MQRTADFHHQVTDTGFPEAAAVVDDAAAFDAAVDRLDADTPAGNAPIGGFLRARAGPAPRLPRRHDDVDSVERERQEAQILEQPAARGQRVRRRIGKALIVGATSLSVTQKEDRERGIDQPHVFDRVALFRAAIIARLFRRILRAPDAPFSAIVAKRGEAGGSGGGGGPSEGMIAAAAASVILMRVANSAQARLGASPSMRHVACRTVNRT
jgi:hypothetical protein